MKKPQLRKSQFVVLVAEGATGNVLSTNFKVYLNDDSEVYFKFDSLELAKNFVNKQKELNDTYEFCIYDNEYMLVEFVGAKKWDQ